MHIRFASILVLWGWGCAVGDDDTAVDAEEKSKGGGQGSNSCKHDRAFDAPPIAAVDIASPAKIHASFTGGTDASGVLTSLYAYDVTNLDTNTTTKLMATVSACFGATYASDGYIEGLDPGAAYRLTVEVADGCGNVGTSAPVDFLMPVQDDTVAPSIAALAMRCGQVFLGSYPFVSFYGSDDQVTAGADFYREAADGSWVYLGTDVPAAMYLYSTSAPGDPRLMDVWTIPVGDTSTYEAVLTDASGNSSVATAVLTVPNCGS